MCSILPSLLVLEEVDALEPVWGPMTRDHKVEEDLARDLRQRQLARAGLCHARIASTNPPTPRMRITHLATEIDEARAHWIIGFHTEWDDCATGLGGVINLPPK